MFFLIFYISIRSLWFELFSFSTSKPNFAHSLSKKPTISLSILDSLFLTFLFIILDAYLTMICCSSSVKYSPFVSYFWNSILSFLFDFLFSWTQKLVFVLGPFDSLVDFRLPSLIRMLLVFFTSFIDTVKVKFSNNYYELIIIKRDGKFREKNHYTQI